MESPENQQADDSGHTIPGQECVTQTRQMMCDIAGVQVGTHDIRVGRESFSCDVAFELNPNCPGLGAKE